MAWVCRRHSGLLVFAFRRNCSRTSMRSTPASSRGSASRSWCRSSRTSVHHVTRRTQARCRPLHGIRLGPLEDVVRSRSAAWVHRARTAERLRPLHDGRRLAGYEWRQQKASTSTPHTKCISLADEVAVVGLTRRTQMRSMRAREAASKQAPVTPV